jgi:tetratricopeptide (TPR) repeat protein
LLEQAPDHRRAHLMLGWTCYFLAGPDQEPGLLDEAVRHLRRGLELSEKELGPNIPPELLGRLGSTHLHLGKALLAARRYAEAERHLEEACRLTAGILAREGTDPDHDSQLAGAYYELGRTRDRLSKPEGALQAYEQARLVYEKLIDHRPRQPVPLRGLSVCLHDLGKLQAEMGRTDQALATLQQALSLREEISRRYPDNLQYHLDLSATWLHVGHTLEKLRRNDEAVQAFREAVTQQRFVWEKGEKSRRDRKWLQERYQALAQLLRRLGRETEAAEQEQEWHKIEG